MDGQGHWRSDEGVRHPLPLLLQEVVRREGGGTDSVTGDLGSKT